MPTVPTYDNLQAQAQPFQERHMQLTEPVTQDYADRETIQQGQGMQQAGGEMGRLTSYFQQQANQVRVQDAYNQALQAKLNLTYDPQNGFLSQKGDAALNRPGGQPLTQEYGDKLNQAISSISDSLGNDAQKQEFAAHAGQMSAQFQGEIDQHLASEYKNYHLSTNIGTIKLEASNAALNWNDPGKIDQSIANARQAVYNMGQLQGKSAQETEADMLGITSNIHLGVIEQAVKSGNYAYAAQYLRKQQDKAAKGGLTQEMSGEDLLKANGLMTNVVNAGVSQAAVSATTQFYQGNISPTNQGRLQNVIIGMESGGKDFNPDGSPVTSPKGALYSHQVTPATAANPGFGIAPAKDNSAAEYNRVGAQYIQALTAKYGGDPAKVMAAYNAGPGALDAAIEKARAAGSEGNYVAFLPKETQAYVSNGMSKLVAGGGAPPMPTEMDFVNHAVSQLGDNPNPNLVQATRQAAQQQYAMITKSRNEQADQVVSQAQQALIANNGDFNGLDPTLKMGIAQLAPDKYESLQRFGKALTGNVKTDLGAYTALVSHPDELYKMSDAQFNLFQSKLAPDDFKHIAQIRADLQSGRASNSPLSIDNTSVNTAITNRLTSLGITPPGRNDKEGLQQVGTVQKFVRDTILSMQQEAGQKFKPEEINAVVDNLFARNLQFRNVLGGFVTGNTTQNMLGMKIGDIPEDSVAAVKVALAKHGVANPTDDQILRTYWTGKLKNGR